jgi:DNA-binding MarR family transcriptional regulator
MGNLNFSPLQSIILVRQEIDMTQKQCIEYLQENSKGTAYEIAEVYDVDPGSIMNNMRSLSKRDYVKMKKEESPTIYEITEKGRETSPEDFQGLVL